MLDDVVRAARGMLAAGLVSGTAGNASARLPDGTVAVTPAGLAYADMTAADLVVVDLDGAVRRGRRTPTSELALHLECYRRFPEIGAVLHTHPVHATVFACLREPVPAAIDEFYLYAGGPVPCADYAPSGTPELAAHAADRLAGVGSALLASHGMVTVARTPEEALHQAEVVERTARIAWGARVVGSLAAVPDEAAARFAAVYRTNRFGAG